MWNQALELPANVFVVGLWPSAEVRRIEQFAFACVTSAPGATGYLSYADASDVRGRGLMSLHMPLEADERLHFEVEIGRARHGLPSTRWHLSEASEHAGNTCALDEAKRLTNAVAELPGSHLVAEHSQLKAQLERFARYLVNGFCSKRVYGGSFAGWVNQYTSGASAPACSAH